MWSGRNTFGNRTTFGNGNNGSRSDMVMVLGDSCWVLGAGDGSLVPGPWCRVPGCRVRPPPVEQHAALGAEHPAPQHLVPSTARSVNSLRLLVHVIHEH